MVMTGSAIIAKLTPVFMALSATNGESLLQIKYILLSLCVQYTVYRYFERCSKK